MATGKRFYWLKLRESFMNSDTVDYFMELPDGANYVVLYQMLCLKTINTQGRLARQIGEMIIPYDIDKIKRDCKWFSVDTIRIALGLYKKFGLIYEDNDGVLVMTEHRNLVGSETDYAIQKKAQRKGIEGLPPSPTIDNGVDNVHTKVHTEEEEKTLDKRYQISNIDIKTEEVPQSSSSSARDSLVKVYGVQVITAYENKYRAWCQKKGRRIDTSNMYNVIVGWIKEDNPTPKPDTAPSACSSIDMDGVMEDVMAKYRGDNS